MHDDDPAPGPWPTDPTTWSDADLLAWLVPPNQIATVQELLAGSGWVGVQRALADTSATLGDRGRLAAAFEVARRVLVPRADLPMQIRAPTDVAQLLQVEMAHLEQEHLRTICVDTKNRIQHIHTVYIGSLNATIVRVGAVFREAIRRNSASIILAHNHPSGCCEPSPEDVAVTKNVVAAGRLLNITLLDHLIIGAGRYCSLAERRLLTT
ncbi:MAG: DNA repair protein RadC [Blastochloris sp.]|nr:DNA repair protein RadC [Blastochloris sp.]